jgi:hypothetical protein
MFTMTYSTEQDKDTAEIQGLCMWVLGFVTAVAVCFIFREK